MKSVLDVIVRLQIGPKSDGPPACFQVGVRVYLFSSPSQLTVVSFANCSQPYRFTACLIIGRYKFRIFGRWVAPRDARGFSAVGILSQALNLLYGDLRLGISKAN